MTGSADPGTDTAATGRAAQPDTSRITAAHAVTAIRNRDFGRRGILNSLERRPHARAEPILTYSVGESLRKRREYPMR